MAICRNCDTEVIGRYCHSCGQSADDYHRNIFILFWEIVKEFFNFDSRLWRTIPTLFFNPGKLVRAQISGKLKQHTPPFRLFLISLFLLVFSLQIKINDLLDSQSLQITEATPNPSMHNNVVDFSFSDTTGNEVVAMDFGPIGKDFGKFMREGDSKLSKEIANSNTDVPWFRDALANAVQNPKVYLLSVFEWTQRLAFLLLPISTLFLGLMYFWRRDIFLFDHALVALSMISFVFLITSICLWLPLPFGLIFYFLTYVLIPLNFYYAFRKGYGSSPIGSFLRSIFTSGGIFIVFVAIILSVMALAGIA